MKIRTYVISCSLLALELCADTTWTNGSLDFTWATSTNWNPAVTPNSSSTTANFTGTAAGTITVAGGSYSVGTLSFTGGNYTFSGAGAAGTLNLYTSITTSGTAGNTNINCPIALQGISTDSILITHETPITIGGAITGSAGLEITGSQIVTFSSSGGNAYTGTTTLNGGSTLAASAGSNFSSGSIVTISATSKLNLHSTNNSVASINGTGTVELGSGVLTLAAASGTFSGKITDTTLGGGLTITAGNLTLSPSPSRLNDYYGATTLSGTGTLTSGTSGAFSINSAVTVSSGGTLALSGSSNLSTISNLSGAAGGSVTLGASTNVLTIGNTITPPSPLASIYAGNITGSGGINIDAGVLLTLTGTGNTYTGTTTITQGSLIAGSGDKLSHGSAVVISNGGTLDISTAGSTPTIGGLGSTLLTGSTATVTLGANTLLSNVPTGTTINFAGAITGSGNFGVNGTGTQILSGSGLNTYAQTFLDSGTLKMGAVNALPTTAPLFTGGAFDLGGYDTTIAYINGSGTVNLATVGLSPPTLTIASTDGAGYTGVISGQGGIKMVSVSEGFGGLNTYSGTTVINGGILTATTTNGTSTSGPFSPNSIFILDGTATLSLITFNQSISNLSGVAGSLVSLGTGTLTIVGSSTESFLGTITGTGGLTMSGTGSLTLGTGGILYTGATTVNSGTLALTGNNTTSSITGSGGVIALSSGVVLTTNTSSNTAYSGVISGAGGISLPGSGQLTLNGNNTYSGPTTLTATSHLIASSSITNTLSPSSSVSITTSAFLDLNSKNNAVKSISGTGTVSLGSGTLSLNGATGTFNGRITGTGGLTLVATPFGSFTLNPTITPNVYFGLTTIENGALLASGVLNAFSQNSTVYVQNGGVLSLNGFDNTIQNLKGDAGSLVSLGVNQLTFGGDNAPQTYAGRITSDATGAGIVSLVKNGTGTFTLNLAGSLPATSPLSNDYTGITTVNSSGKFQAGAIKAFSPYSVIQLNGTSTLDLNGFDNTIADLNGVVGTFVTLGSGTLTIGGTIATPASGTFNGIISGSGGLTVTNSGNFTLGTAGNAYTGTTFVNEFSFLSAGAAGVFSPTSPVILINHGGLQLNGFANTIASLTGDSGSLVNLGSGAVGTLTVGDSTLSTTYAGAITSVTSPGGSGIIKQGSGTLQLTGTGLNTYSGPTQINAGTLKAGAANALSANSAVTIASGAILDVSPVFTPAINNTISSLASSSAGSFVLLGANGLTLGDSTNTIYAGSIIGVGGNIIKQGSGTFQLSGSGLNTYSGSTLINAGTFQAGATNAFSSQSAVTIASTAILDLNSFDNTIASVDSSSGGSFVNLTANNLTLASNNSTIYAGTILGVGGQLTKQGSGTLTLSGSGLNVYSGNTTISAGSIKAGAVNGFSANSEVVVNSGSLNLNSKNNTIANLSGSGGSVLLGIATLQFGNGNSRSYDGSISGYNTATGAITKVGAGTFTLNGTNNTYGGTTTVSGGTWQAGAMNAFSTNSTIDLAVGTTLDLNNFSNVIGGLSGAGGIVNLTNTGVLTTGFNNASTTYAGTITGVGPIIKIGTGTMILSTLSGSTYSDGTQINGGAISISNDNQLGSSIGPLGLNNGTLITTTSLVTSARDVTLTNTGTFNTVSALTVSGSVTGTGGLTKTGSAVLTLSGSGDLYSGPTTISAGTLRAGVAGAFSPSSEVTLANVLGAILDLNSTANTIANLSGGGTFGGNVTLGTGALTVGNSNSTVYAGVISGTGVTGISKTGSGLLNLTGINTYTGTTTVSGGTLSVNGVINSSTTTVNSGATLRGSGLIVGNVLSSGTTAPGNSVGTLTITGNYTALSGSNFQVEVDPTSADNLTTTGTTTINGNTTITVIPFRGFYTLNTPYQVITATGGLSGTFTNVVATLDRAEIELQYFPNALILTVIIKSFEDVALGFNARNVAHVLDIITQAEPPAWGTTLDMLFDLSIAELNVALNQLVPAQLKGLSIIQQNNAVRVQNAISLRFQNLLDKMNCQERRGCSKKNCPAYVWVDGFNSKLRQPSNFIDTNPQVGYHSNTGGGSLGIDLNLLEHCYLGIMGAGTYSDVTWVNDQGKGHINSGYVGLYGSVIGEKKFVNLSLLGSVNKYGAARNIIYPGVNETAHSSHKGLQLLSHLDFGLNINTGGVAIRPFESMDYIIQHENKFQEDGAGILDLDVQKTNPQIFRNELGVNFARCFNISKRSRILADLKFSWVSENRVTGTLFTSSFVNLDSLTFLTEGYYPNRNFFSPGGSLTGNFANDTVYITVTYDAEIGHHYLDQRTGAQFGFRF